MAYPKSPSPAIRASVSFTQETFRQLNDICAVYGENRSHTLRRCIQMIHSALRTTPPEEETKKDV